MKTRRDFLKGTTALVFAGAYSYVTGAPIVGTVRAPAFHITGTDAAGRVRTEIVTAGTGSVGYFKTINGIAPA